MIVHGDRVYLTPNAGPGLDGREARVEAVKPGGGLVVRVPGRTALLHVPALGFIPFYKAEVKR